MIRKRTVLWLLFFVLVWTNSASAGSIQKTIQAVMAGEPSGLYPLVQDHFADPSQTTHAGSCLDQRTLQLSGAGLLLVEGPGWDPLPPKTAGETVKIPDPPKRNRCIAIMPPIDPSRPEDPADPHLRNYLGQMKDIDQIYEAKTVDEFYDILSRAARSGSPLGRLIILGHGRDDKPGIKLGGQNRLEMPDIDLKELQNKLRKMIEEYVKSRDLYCQAIVAGKKPDIKIAHNVRNLPAKIAEMAETVRRRQKQMKSVAEAMADFGQIMLLNCYGASTQKHEEFARQLGRVLMWKHTGGYVTASKRRIDVNLIEGGQTGYSMVDHLIGSCRIVQAFVKTARVVKPGDYYVSGAGVDYFNWKDLAIPSGGQPPYAESLIDPDLLAQAAGYKGMGMPECSKKPQAPTAPPRDKYKTIQGYV